MILNGDLWNELYVNTYKAKYIFFYKEKDEDNISLYFKDLKINNICLIQANNILSVFLDKNLNWQSHIALILNTIFKNRIIIQGKSYNAKKMS